MRNLAKPIFGGILILVGIFWILNVFNLVDLSYSLRGWWALFVIVPCLGGLFTDKDKVGPLMGITIGVLLLLAARDVLTWTMFGELSLAVLVIGFGVKLIIGKDEFEQDHKGQFKVEDITSDGKNIKAVEFSFGKQDLSLSGVKFEGMKLKASFGTLHIDLRDAIIEKDADLVVDASFCGVVIYVPENIVVKTSVSCGFAGVTDNRRSKPMEGYPVLFITGKAGFSGIELK